jgi:protein subunit release factor B
MDQKNSLNPLEAANERLAKLGVRESDLTEQFIHSGGHGGQNVNKVATAVRLTYARGNIDIKCMEERSQSLNRARARGILADKIEKKREDARLFARAEAERLRKKKAGRPRSIKRKILKDKRMNSRMKKNRKYDPGRDE